MIKELAAGVHDKNMLYCPPFFPLVSHTTILFLQRLSRNGRAGYVGQITGSEEFAFPLD